MKKILIFLIILFLSLEVSFAYSGFDCCADSSDSGPKDYLNKLLNRDRYTFNSNDLIFSHENTTSYRIQVLHDGIPVKTNQEVRFFINGINYTRFTDENGTAALDINLESGHYIICSEYKNFKNYNNILIFD